YSGAVDMVFLVKREGGQGSRRRTLDYVGRPISPPPSITIELIDGAYRVLGKGKGTVAADDRAAVLAVAPKTAGEAIYSDALFERAKEYRPSVKVKTIKDLLMDGTLKRAGGGVKGNAYRLYTPSGEAAP